MFDRVPNNGGIPAELGTVYKARDGQTLQSTVRALGGYQRVPAGVSFFRAPEGCEFTLARFGSVHDLYDHAVAMLPKMDYRSRQDAEPKDFEEAKRGASTFGSAVRSGIDAEAFQRSRPMPQPDYSVSGAYLDVPSFCAGAPDCYVTEDEDGTTPVFAFVHNVSTDGSWGDLEFRNRGIALVAIMRELEEAGCRTELTIIRCNRGAYPEGARQLQIVDIKAAGDPINYDVVGWWLGSSDALRNVKWPYTRAAWKACDLYGRKSYGGPITPEPDWFDPEDRAVVLPTTVDTLAFATPESAMATMRTILGACAAGGGMASGPAIERLAREGIIRLEGAGS